MYWWIKKISRLQRIAIGIFVSTASFFACTATNPIKQAHTEEKQFDIPAFFQQEIQHLSETKKEISKTVAKDSSAETKKILIQDWEKELSAFSSIDLNKTAYIGHINKDSSDHLVKLTLDDPTADISAVHIRYDEHNNPSGILIFKKINNLLYQTTESLSYQKDKGYKIEKQQDVWLLGSNHYTIEGKF